MLVIFSASADRNSMEHSSRIMGPIIRFFYPDISAPDFFRALLLGRKIAHVSVYAVLAVLLWFAFNSTFALRPRQWHWPVRWTMALVILYAIADEAHQALVPARQGSVWDVVIDTAGGALALVLIWAFGRLRTKRAARLQPS
jgi:VanZ family protein